MNDERRENGLHRFPKKVWFTAPPEIYDALQRHGMSKVDSLINNLLSEYFEKRGVVNNARRKE